MDPNTDDSASSTTTALVATTAAAFSIYDKDALSKPDNTGASSTPVCVTPRKTIGEVNPSSFTVKDTVLFVSSPVLLYVTDRNSVW